MLYALKNDEIIPASPSMNAICPLCKQDVISKCGDVNIWHWAHKNLSECDSWSEGMGEWHYNWQKILPPENIEVTIKHNGISHRADIVLNDGTVIELQSSPISIDEIKEREEFYGNMIWVFNLQGKYIEVEKRYGKYGKYHAFTWKWARKSASFCKAPVMLDVNTYQLLDERNEDDEIIEWIEGVLAVKKFYQNFKYGWGYWHSREVIANMLIDRCKK